MLVVGTTVNLLATLGSVVALERGLGAIPATVIFFSPVPYNVFLFLGVWRTASTAPARRALAARATAAVWMLLVTLI